MLSFPFSEILSFEKCLFSLSLCVFVHVRVHMCVHMLVCLMYVRTCVEDRNFRVYSQNV